MANCEICNLCQNPGSYEEARDVARVPCHVRKFSSEVFTVWRCENCRSLHCKEDVDLVRFYSDYPFKQHHLDFHTRIGYRNRLRLLKKGGVTRSSKVLDYGCGAGLFVQFLKEEGLSQVFGYDAFVDQYSDRSVLHPGYDVIVSHDVIEHVDQPVEFLRTLVPLLNRGGLLVIGTPNAEHIELKPRPYFAVELSQPYHRHILSERALNGLIEQFSLKVEHRYPRFYFDSLYPGVNTKFMWSYVNATGGYIDACVEPPKFEILWSHPQLIFFALFGYFFPPRTNLLLSLRKG